MDEYLTGKRCTDCGEDDVVVLEFDHLHSKGGDMTTFVGDGSSPRRLLREAAKCEIVCASCHRVRTAARGGSWRSAPERLESNSHLVAGERRNMVYVRDLLLRSYCIDCGERRLVVLDFDHVGTKTGLVIELARRGCGLRRLVDEIAQCEIRCANCHRRRTLHAQARKSITAA